MTPEVVVALFALIVSIGTATWTVWYNLSINNSQKSHKTTELLVLFSRTSFHESRGIGWELLDEVNKSEPAITFQHLWDTKDERQNHRIQNLYSVFEFWHMLYILGEDDELNKELANKIFSFEYYWWSKQSRKLIENTLNSDEPIPDVFQIFINNPEWLKSKSLKK